MTSMRDNVIVTRENCLALVNLMCDRLNEPVPQATGTGIVMVAGGPVYLRMAFSTVSRIRDMGCTLPIQIWHLGPKELDDESRGQFSHLKVQFVDAIEVNLRYNDLKRVKGWETKSLAIARCPFRHVMLLDADSVPMINPEELFNSPEYKQWGAIFWPDIRDNRPSDEIFISLGLKFKSFQELEAGQLMIDKVRHWKPVQLNAWFSYHSYYFFRICFGDKDYPGLSFCKLRTPYLQAPKCTWEPYGIAHYWMDGRLAFAHEMDAKRNPQASLHPETIKYQLSFEYKKQDRLLPTYLLNKIPQ